MQLARARGERAVGRDDDRGVEAQAVVGVGALVERGVDVDAGLARELRGERARRPVGDRLGLGAGRLRPVGGDGEVRRERQLLQAHELRALAGGHAHALGQRGAVLVGIGVPALLDEPDAQRRTRRLLHARERRRRLADGRDQLQIAHAAESR